MPIKCVFGVAATAMFMEKCYLYMFGYGKNTVGS